MPAPPFLTVAAERGFIHQCTDFAALDARLAAGPVTAYVGYDCTADSLHIGNLMSIMLFALVPEDWQQADRADGRRHDPDRRPIGQRRIPSAAVGRADRPQHGRDPSGLRQIPCNSASVRPMPTWSTTPIGSNELRYIPLLRRCRGHFSVTPHADPGQVRLRLERDSRVLSRIQLPILQAYDFVRAGRRMGCELQMGGSDQWATSSPASSWVGAATGGRCSG